MLSPCALIGFIPAADLDRARDFYVNVLKLKLLGNDGFALVVKTDASMIRIVKMEQVAAAPFTILGWEVKDIAAEVKELTAAGIAFSRYSFLEQDDLGIWTAPTGDKVAWFQDPDGNVLSVSQH